MIKPHKGVVAAVRWRDVPVEGSYSDEEGEGAEASRLLLAAPTTLLSAGRDGRCAVLRQEGERLESVVAKACHVGRVLCAAWDGARDDALQLVTGSDDQSLRVWQVPGHA